MHKRLAIGVFICISFALVVWGQRTLDARQAMVGKIAFAKADKLSMDIPLNIWLMDTDGGNAQPLTTSSGKYDDKAQPAWTPDGTRLAFNAPQPTIDKPGELYTCTLADEGSGHFRLDNIKNRTNDNTTDDYDPDWAPTCDRFVYSSGKDFANYELMVYQIDGNDNGTSTRITHNAVDELEPRWSPIDNRVAFVRANAIWIIDLNNLHEIQLTSGGIDASPAWSPDGSKIAFSRGDEGGKVSRIFLIDSNGGNSTPSTDPPLNSFDVQTSFSPDGSEFAFARLTDNFRLGDIYRKHLSNGSETNITNTPNKVEFMPAWRPARSCTSVKNRIHDLLRRTWAR